MLVFWALGRPSAATTGEIVHERLQAYGGERPLTLEELELQRPFSERLLRPGLEWVSSAIQSRTPEKARLDLDTRLLLAGRPGNLSAGEFIAVRYAAGTLLFLVGMVLGLMIGTPLWLAV